MRPSVTVGALAVALSVALITVLAAPTVTGIPAGSGADSGPGQPGLSWRWTAAGACPHYCHCYRTDGAGLNAADCTGRRLVSAEDLELPRDTDVVDLSDNAISTLSDGSFRTQGLARLLELRLARNGIGEVGAWAFAGMRRLHLLDLSHNHLQVLHPGTFDDNRGLKVLLLAGNNLAQLPADRPLLFAPRLRVLDLSDCRLAHLGATVLSELPELASLNLSANYLIQVQTQALSRLGQLQELDLTSNPLACDLNTRQLVQSFAARNATVSTSCPAVEPRGAIAQLSKHLARLQGPVLPGPVQHDGRGAGEGSFETADKVESSTTFDLAQLTPLTHERMVGLTDTDLTHLIQWPLGPDEIESLEEDYSNNNSASEEEDTNRSRDATGCTRLFPERTSKNPILVRDWFDQIPSFWAALFGCQVGLVLGLVLASCACRLASWRAFCCRPASVESSRPRGWRNRRGRNRLSPEMAYGLAAADSWENDLVAIAAAPPCDEETERSVFSTEEGVRSETPPPAYADLDSVNWRHVSPGYLEMPPRSPALRPSGGGW